MAGRTGTGVPVFPSTPSLSAPGGHYSHVVVANGFIFISGQLPITAAGQKLSGSNFRDQTEQVLNNLASALRSIGAGPQNLVQVRVYLADINDWQIFNDIYSLWVGEGKPARTIVPTGPLHFGLRIEVEAIAISPTSDTSGSLASRPSTSP